MSRAEINRIGLLSRRGAYAVRVAVHEGDGGMIIWGGPIKDKVYYRRSAFAFLSDELAVAIFAFDHIGFGKAVPDNRMSERTAAAVARDAVAIGADLYNFRWLHCHEVYGGIKLHRSGVAQKYPSSSSRKNPLR